jgi:hypothetical protein
VRDDVLHAGLSKTPTDERPHRLCRIAAAPVIGMDPVADLELVFRVRAAPEA